MTQYTEKDFTRLPFNPMGKKRLMDGPLKKIIKPLQNEGEEERQEELLTDSEIELVLRWIVAMYDQGSPLIKQYPDIAQRKRAAALVAGIESEKLLDNVFDHKVDGVPAVINAYLRNYGQNRLWAMIVAQEAQFWEYQYRLMKPVEGSKDKDILQSIDLKSKIAAELDLMNTRLDGYYAKLYGDDNELASISKAKRLTPEAIADVLTN